MKRDKRSSIILLGIIILIAISSLFKIKGLHNSINQISKNATKWENKYQQILNNDLIRVKSEGKIIPANLLGYNLDEKEINICDLIMESPKWIFRFSFKGCLVCVDSIVTKLNLISDLITNNNFMILASFTDWDQIYAYKRFNRINLPFYIIEENSLGIFVENTNFPFFFKTNSNRIVNQLVIHDKYLPEVMNNFYTYLKEDLKNSESMDD